LSRLQLSLRTSWTRLSNIRRPPNSLMALEPSLLEQVSPTSHSSRVEGFGGGSLGGCLSISAVAISLAGFALISALRLDFGQAVVAFLAIALVTVTLGSLASAATASHKDDVQQEAEEIARSGRTVAGHAAPVALYLRPFKFDLMSAVGHNITSGGTGTFRETVISFEEELGKRCQDLGLILRSIGPKTGQLGPVATTVSDLDWQAAFTDLVPTASAIIIFPGASEGSLWEIKEVTKSPGTLRRCIWIMPPTPMLKNEFPLEELWSKLLEICRLEMRLPFPRWTASGAIFCYSGSVGEWRITMREFAWPLIAGALAEAVSRRSLARPAEMD